MSASSSGDVIGELSLKCEDKWKIEWTIQNFFSYTKADEMFYSSYFTIPRSLWLLKISPNGETGDNSVGWISVYLYIASNQELPKKAIFTFGVKKADGTVTESCEITHEFKVYEGFGIAKFLDRSELLKEKSQLAPMDALTVTCVLQVKENSNSISRLIKVSEFMEGLLASKKFTDVTLKVKGEEFATHKFVLAAQSSVFAAMFEHDMKENTTGVVDIEDCEPEVFRHFLAYLYSGKFRISPSNMFEMYRIAHKYDVLELKRECIAFIVSNLSLENVCDAVILGDQFDEEEINVEFRDFFVKNFKKIVHTSEWVSFLKKNRRLANRLLKSLAEKM